MGGGRWETGVAIGLQAPISITDAHGYRVEDSTRRAWGSTEPGNPARNGCVYIAVWSQRRARAGAWGISTGLNCAHTAHRPPSTPNTGRAQRESAEAGTKQAQI